MSSWFSSCIPRLREHGVRHALPADADHGGQRVAEPAEVTLLLAGELHRRRCITARRRGSRGRRRAWLGYPGRPWTIPAPPSRPARLARVEAALAQRLGSVVAVAESVRRRHNASAILRTCEAFGVHEVHLVTAGFRPSVGAARGAERWVRRRRFDTTAASLGDLKARGLPHLRGGPAPGALTPESGAGGRAGRRAGVRQRGARRERRGTRAGRRRRDNPDGASRSRSTSRSPPRSCSAR